MQHLHLQQSDAVTSVQPSIIAASCSTPNPASIPVLVLTTHPLDTPTTPSIQPSISTNRSLYPVQSSGKAPLHSLNNDYSPAFLSRTRAISCSRGNFAANLNRSWFTEEEHLSCNVRGRNGKRELSPSRIQQIHDAVFHMYPLTQNEDPKRAWGECIKAIDVSNRQLKRKGKEN